MQAPAETEGALWRIVPLAEFRLPATPAQEAASKRLHAFRRLFQADVPEQTPAKAAAELRSLPPARLDAVAPPIDWRLATDALNLRLGAWALPGATADGLRFVIAPPHAGHGELVQAWAEAQGWSVVAPPSSAQILADDPAWLADWAATDCWALPRLERCFLRHATGFGLVRRFLDLAVGGRLGRGIIGCDSWAWAFLQQVWKVPQPQVCVLQAFDGERLAAYFGRTLHDSTGRPIPVRNAGSGQEILSAVAPDAGSEVAVSGDLKRLAAHCRGNLGIAWAYWRAGFRAEPVAPASTSAADGEGEAADAQDTLWWTAERNEPALPPETEDAVAHLLHALLLHDGLSSDLLAQLLPGSRRVHGAIMQRLRCAGLLACADDRWRVAPLGYAAVREFLGGRGYLIDPF